MDTVISRMMQLLGAVLVLGMVASGVETVQLKDWDGATAFLAFAVVSAAIFTFIWTISTFKMTKLIGKNGKRSDFIQKSIVGISVGILALFTCLGFVTAGFAATNATNNSYALTFYAWGSISTAVLCIIWTWAELKFVDEYKNK